MLLASIGDILTIRKHYQKTFKLDSDENSSDNSLTCLSTGKLEFLLTELGEEPLTGATLWEIFSEALVEVPMAEANNFYMEIYDPDAGGNSNMGFSGKDKYDSYNFYEPESLDDNREYDDPTLEVNKGKKVDPNSEFNQRRTTSTGRKARVNF